MNVQNDPLWNNGQTPTSGSAQEQTPEQDAKKQNDKSAKNKRRH